MIRPSTDSAAHTPGPWMVTHELRTSDETVCDLVNDTRVVVQRPLGDWKADARLISAAPDLLAACEAALNDRMFKDWPGVATLLINAIKKARGE